MDKKKLLVATHNRGKVKEYQELLRGLPVDLISLDDAGITLDVEETGSTFYENAWLKARAYSALGTCSHYPTIQDSKLMPWAAIPEFTLLVTEGVLQFRRG